MLDKELRRECVNMLQNLVDQRDVVVVLTMGSSEIEGEALNYLISKGCLMERGNNGYSISATGRQYLEQLTTPMPVYWFRMNWFPATVALATIISGVATAIAQFIGVFR